MWKARTRAPSAIARASSASRGVEVATAALRPWEKISSSPSSAELAPPAKKKFVIADTKPALLPPSLRRLFAFSRLNESDGGLDVTFLRLVRLC